MTRTTINTENMEILNMFLRNNSNIIDNHTGDTIDDAIALIEYNSDTKPLGLALDYWCYCINEVYLDEDKKLHLSTCSIGGNLYGTPTIEKILKYNESALFDGGKIKRVWFHDGSIIELDLGDIDLENEEA